MVEIFKIGQKLQRSKEELWWRWIWRKNINNEIVYIAYMVKFNYSNVKIFKQLYIMIFLTFINVW